MLTLFFLSQFLTQAAGVNLRSVAMASSVAMKAACNSRSLVRCEDSERTAPRPSSMSALEFPTPVLSKRDVAFDVMQHFAFDNLISFPANVAPQEKSLFREFSSSLTQPRSEAETPRTFDELMRDGQYHHEGVVLHAFFRDVILPKVRAFVVKVGRQAEEMLSRWYRVEEEGIPTLPEAVKSGKIHSDGYLFSLAVRDVLKERRAAREE